MIDLNVKTKYAIAALFELAMVEKMGPIQIKTIAEKRQIPQNYLEQLLVELKRAGILRSFRGANGGYQLARPASNITLYDIVVCLEGPINLGGNVCDCPTLSNVWESIENGIGDVFNGSLESLVLEAQRREGIGTYTI